MSSKKNQMCSPKFNNNKTQIILQSENNVGYLCNNLYRPQIPYLLVSNFKVSLAGLRKPTQLYIIQKGLIHYFGVVLTLTGNI